MGRGAPHPTTPKRTDRSQKDLNGRPAPNETMSESLALVPLATVTIGRRPSSSSGHCPSRFAIPKHIHSNHARPGYSCRNQLVPTLECTTLQLTPLAHGPSGPGLDGTQLQEPIQAEARRRTNPEAHPGRGSAAQTSRSPSNPGLDGEPIQEPIQAEARRRTNPGAHPGRGSAAQTSRSPSRPGLDGAQIQEAGAGGNFQQPAERNDTKRKCTTRVRHTVSLFFLSKHSFFHILHINFFIVTCASDPTARSAENNLLTDFFYIITFSS